LNVAPNADSEPTPAGDVASFALPPDFLTLPTRERRAVVEDLARRRTIRRDSLRDVIAHTYEDGDPDVIGALSFALELDPDRVVKRAAAAGLGRIPSKTVIPALRGALSATDRATKSHAIITLGRLRAREAVPDLVRLLDDSYSRTAVAHALVAIGDEDALGPLRQAAARGPRFRRRRLQQRVSELESALGDRRSA
jgi:HEAT repeat protein